MQLINQNEHFLNKHSIAKSLTANFQEIFKIYGKIQRDTSKIGT